MTLFLVRHGRPVIDRTRPAHEWSLDPAYDDDVRALRGRLSGATAWYSSPEPKAFMTARLLTEAPIEIVPDLREHERHGADWIEDFGDAVRRAFAEPTLFRLAYSYEQGTHHRKPPRTTPPLRGESSDR